MNHPWTPEEWHHWFLRQAEWTRPTRLWLYRQAGLGEARRVLEVGCGTGVIAAEVARLCSAGVVGLDVDGGMLEAARRHTPQVALVQGDARALPFGDGAFDLVLCHYLLLWLKEPARAVSEMARVVRAGGFVLACAEPDYGGRIDHPPELVLLGQLQAEALRLQGADPRMGRRLGELFVAAGLRTTVGVMAGRWELPSAPDDAFAAEWAVRRRDLLAYLPPEELDRLEEADREALQAGRRILFVPTFYALGKKPSR
ncbi:MAG: methyltransferase domain-containing protein [Chloroflexia bacterium]